MQQAATASSHVTATGSAYSREEEEFEDAPSEEEPSEVEPSEEEPSEEEPTEEEGDEASELEEGEAIATNHATGAMGDSVSPTAKRQKLRTHMSTGLSERSQSAATPSSGSEEGDGSCNDTFYGGEVSDLGPDASRAVEIELCNVMRSWSYRVNETMDPVHVAQGTYHLLPPEMLTHGSRIGSKLARQLIKPDQTQQKAAQLSQALNRKLVSSNIQPYNGEWLVRRAASAQATAEDLSQPSRRSTPVSPRVAPLDGAIPEQPPPTVKTSGRLGSGMGGVDVQALADACSRKCELNFLKEMASKSPTPKIEDVVMDLCETLGLPDIEGEVRLGLAQLLTVYLKQLKDETETIPPTASRIVGALVQQLIHGDPMMSLEKLIPWMKSAAQWDYLIEIEVKYCMDLDNASDQWDYLIGMKLKHRIKLKECKKLKEFDLCTAANDAYNEWYKKPYDGKPIAMSEEAMKDFFDLEYRAWGGIERPNHGIAHAIRKAMLVTRVASAYCEANNIEKTKLPPDEAMQLAMLLEVAGRRSDVGYGKYPEEYTSYKEDSCKAYEKVSKVLNLTGREQCLQGLRSMYTAHKNGSIFHVVQVFEICHDLELLRCFGEEEMRDKVMKIRDRLGKSVNLLLLCAEAAIIATGDRLTYSARGWRSQCEKRDSRVFPDCSKNPERCISMVENGHLLAEIVIEQEKQLDAAFNSSNKLFQEKVLGDSWQHVLRKMHSFEKHNETSLKKWLRQMVVTTTKKLLKQLSKEEKKTLLACGPACEDEADENDSMLLQVAQKKLELSFEQGTSINTARNALSTSKFIHNSCWDIVQGAEGFNHKARAMMRENHVPHRKAVFTPGSEPCVQPYQETLSYLVHPRAFPPHKRPAQRMLVVHRTGAGKTCSMIRVADNYFKDKRPKILLFPSPAVCSNFYKELLDPKFPNMYADYLNREHPDGDVRACLELKGKLVCGRVQSEYVNHPSRPSAPLRAFSYTQAGGTQACGANGGINAVFKCPDGYNGGWNYGAGDTKPEYGYKEYTSDGNPFSNKIILMDEVHNLVNPSDDIAKDPRRLAMLDRLKYMLQTATNSVLVGFTATPLVEDSLVEGKKQWTYRPLLDIIKGDSNLNKSDEGFVSYFMGAPTPVFPEVIPVGVPENVPEELTHKFELRNWPVTWEKPKPQRKPSKSPSQPPRPPKTPSMPKPQDKPAKLLKKPKGNLTSYLDLDEKEHTKKAERCSVGMSALHAASWKVIQVLKGAEGKLLNMEFGQENGVNRLEGFSTKLYEVCRKIGEGGELKTLVLVHDRHGFKLLAKMLDEYFPGVTCAYAGIDDKQVQSWKDETLKKLVGNKHDPKLVATRDGCRCNLCRFNSNSNLRGEDLRIMIADAKFCSEGVSFFCVRQLHLVDIPPSVTSYLQRVGRAIRFNGHAGLPPEECKVSVHLYCATLPSGHEPSESEDVKALKKLRDQVQAYHNTLRELRDIAVDKDMWSEDGQNLGYIDQTSASESQPLLEKALAAIYQAKKNSSLPTVKSRQSRNFADSNYKKALKEIPTGYSPTAADVWEATECVVKSYAGEASAKDYMCKMHEAVKEYKANDDPTFCAGSAAQLSMLLWTSLETVRGVGLELCSLLNRCFREDEEGSTLKAALRFRSALKESVVKLAIAQMHVQWPNGPNAKGLDWSTERDVTFRGGALPHEHLQFYSVGRKFRTQHYVSTSFDRDVAEHFMSLKGGENKALWKFKFIHRSCAHVAFLNRSAVKSEREFLLEPYTVLTVVNCSSEAGDKVSWIEVDVAEDNQSHEEDLLLAPWI